MASCSIDLRSQYAEHLPIGLERVIQTVSADTVEQFYGKWYHLHNMAVIAVGDFSDTQVARVRLHGFSECEISVARALLMSKIESGYLERDQMQSTSLRDEYLQHFLRNEPIVGVKYEAQRQKLDYHQFEYSNIGATELILSNGMRVCYKYTDFFDDQPIRIGDLKKVDPFKACEYFNNCFKDPSTFTVVIVGNIDPAIACPLILQYLMEVVKPLVCTPLAMLAPGGADLEMVVFRSSGALTMLNDDVGLKDGFG
ncbi:Zinc protease PQQL-like [Camellia lanceoleosa]|uniref:Zinc protease PQQL-like n=1 Tax=Camellia lanceoleosa TaxID=1840588 RepID=A0ACC0FJR5_9ERIC|nr:Zinc protease PQQL-like [Camellia lanceoleosa]